LFDKHNQFLLKKGETMDKRVKEAEQMKTRVVELEKELEAQKKSAINHAPVGQKTNSDEQKAL